MCKLTAAIVLLLCGFCVPTAMGGVLWDPRQPHYRPWDRAGLRYWRYTQRRPSPYPSDAFMENVVEIFRVPNKPPAFSLNDDSIDKILRCDFQPALPECLKFQKQPTSSPKPPTSTDISTAATTAVTPATTTTTTTAVVPVQIESTTTVVSVDTSTTMAKPIPTATTPLTTSTTLPDDVFFLPNIFHDSPEDITEGTTTTANESDFIGDVDVAAADYVGEDDYDEDYYESDDAPTQEFAEPLKYTLRTTLDRFSRRSLF